MLARMHTVLHSPTGQPREVSRYSSRSRGSRYAAEAFIPAEWHSAARLRCSLEALPVSATRRLNLLLGWFSSTAGSSYSHSFPSSMTTTRSNSMMVFSRWAIANTVQSASTSWRVACMSRSVSRSTDAVASSRKKIFDLRRRALPMQNSDRCPTLKFSPFSSTGACSCPGKLRTTSYRLTRFNASQTSSSVLLRKGSRLSRTVPVNITGSCGITDRRERSVCRPTLEMSTPSMNTRPFQASRIRNNAREMVLLPAPVRPTMAIFSPALTSNERSSTMAASSGRYLMNTLLNSSLPSAGHSGLTFSSRTCHGASDGRWCR
mmetsp:Transcript_39764/g.100208  ORF Transcript_39764/g.100208 Transcript_39764/m.100208 type:complete len:319 (+) Transcript_39764:196-1152(+)